MMVKTLIFVFVCSISLAGCEKRMSYGDLDAIRVNAANALVMAEKANTALDEGAASSTTMGSEIEEAKSDASQAKEIAAQAWNETQEIKSRLDTICNKAPALCN